jgi:hypothetical protein
MGCSNAAPVHGNEEKIGTQAHSQESSRELREMDEAGCAITLKDVGPRGRGGEGGMDQAYVGIGLGEIAPHAHVGGFVVFG